MKKLILILSMLVGVTTMFVGVTHAQIILNSDIVTASQRSVDGKQYKIVAGKHVPYTNAAEVLSTIVSTRRHVGQIFYVGDAMYHFVGGITNSDLKLYADTVGVIKTVTFEATSTTTFNVTFTERPDATYKVSVTPASSIAAVPFYVANKTTTGFDIVVLEALTGTVTYDIILLQ